MSEEGGATIGIVQMKINEIAFTTVKDWDIVNFSGVLIGTRTFRNRSLIDSNH